MDQTSGSLLAAILTVAAVPVAAQWLNYPTPGIPRLPDGKPDLAAPVPRKPDGRPYLSGIWKGVPRNQNFVRNLGVDLKPGEFPIRPWAEALTAERMTDAGQKEQPPAHCLPPGIPILDAAGAGYPLKIIQEPALVVILYEAMGTFRQVFLDARTLPKDSNPRWMGYSVGRWDGDTLVTDTAGFNGKMWLDLSGHPSTDALYITERFQRRDFGHLDLQLTIDDPKAYTKPWTVNESWQIFPGTELLEYVCNENEKDVKHMVGK